MTKLIRFTILAAIISLICQTCKKDDEFYHITAYEENLHYYVNEYRKSKGLNELVLQPVMVIEAQANSVDWKNGGDPSTGLQDRFETVIEKIGGTSNGAITSIVYNLSADSVVHYWARDTIADKILLGTYTQSGPGIARGNDDKIYVTHMFLYIPK
ncbi:MAG: hypothetical protein AMS27_01865 [Bacteroides sp. SM23_62_1]|nr:MAG: hypothetical protein AMS27_01865 [Bacteroides sp. SM23_62_1]